LKGFWKKIPGVLRLLIFPLPVALLGWIVLFEPESFEAIKNKSDFSDSMIVIGAVGQLMLNFRYFYQWYYSEKPNKVFYRLAFG
jgi:hypothetical protein